MGFNSAFKGLMFHLWIQEIVWINSDKQGG